MNEATNPLNIGAVILAAGASTRMGTPKQTLQFEGKTLLRRTTLAAIDAGCYPVVVVTGANAQLCGAELDGLPIQDVFNENWETGMASSIRKGIEALPKVDAAIFLLCDQPHVTSDVILNLATCYRASEIPIIASTYGDSYGVPALFGSRHFAELSSLEGAAGAKQIIKRHASNTYYLPFPKGEIDIDTPEDFHRLTANTTHA